jgi:hypothetical protein
MKKSEVRIVLTQINNAWSLEYGYYKDPIVFRKSGIFRINHRSETQNFKYGHRTRLGGKKFNFDAKFSLKYPQKNV